MADALGHNSILGLRTDTAGWDSAYATVNVACHSNSEGIAETYDRIEKNALIGKGGREPSEQGNVGVIGQTTHELDYNNFDWFFEALFGQVSTRAFELTDDHVGKYYWMEWDKGVTGWRYGAAKAAKMTISGEKNGLIMLSMDHVCRSHAKGAAAGIAAPSNMNRVLFSNGVFRIADQADALAGGDAIGWESFEIVIDRMYKADDYTNEQIYAIEPVPGDFREVSMSFAIPRYEAAIDDIVTWKGADTPLQADLTFTRGAETFVLELPELRVTDGFGVNIDGPAPLRQEGSLRAFLNQDNAYMSINNEIKATFT